MYFPPIPGVSLKTLIKAMHNSQERSLWDKDVESGEVIKLSPPTIQEEADQQAPAEHLSNALMNYQRIKSAVSYIQKREFVEKKLKFKVKVEQIQGVKGKHTRHFVYFSSLPDEFRPIDKNVTRAKVLFGIHMFEKLEDGRLHF